MFAGSVALLNPPPAIATAPAPCEVGTSYAGGDGTSATPHLIATAAQLGKLSTETLSTRLDDHFRLTADIDLGGCLWTTTQSFTGTFDGDGYVIKNFRVEGGAGVKNVAFFSSVWSGGTVRNLGIENATVVSLNDRVGILVGNLSGTISNTYVTGSVTGRASVGGLAGQASSTSTVENSYSRASVTVAASSGSLYGGGLVGFGEGTHKFSYAAGAMNASADGVTLSTTNFSSGLLGGGSNARQPTVQNSFYDRDVTGLSDDVGDGKPKTTLEMKDISTFNDLSTDGLDTVWSIVQGWEPFNPGSNKVWGIAAEANDGYPFLLFQYTGAVTFDANGGTGSMSDQYGRNSEVLTANTFSRSGYTFAGWNTSADGSGSTHADSASFAFSGNQTLYAQWTALPSAPSSSSSSSGGSSSSGATPATTTPPIILGSAPKASTVPTPTPLTVQDTRTPSSLTLWKDNQRFGGDVSPTDDSVVVSAGDIEFSLSLSDRLGLAEFDSSGNLSTFGPTDLSFLSSGLYPGSPVQVFFGQQGEEVGRAFVGPDGSVQLDLSAYDFAAGSEIPVGPQRVQITTYDANGSVVVIDFLMQVGQPPIRPMLDPESGQLPALGPGIATGSSGGKASPVDVLWLREQGVLTLGGESWSVSLENLGQQGAEGAESDSFPSMVLGSESLISGNGLLPGSTASVWMYPGEILLGQIVVDENGEFTISYLVDSRILAPGSYTLQVHGIGLDGLSKSINVGIEVTSSEEGLTAGARSSLLLTATIAAMGLVVAGGFSWFLIVRRRRSRNDGRVSLGQG